MWGKVLLICAAVIFTFVGIVAFFTFLSVTSPGVCVSGQNFSCIFSEALRLLPVVSVAYLAFISAVIIASIFAFIMET